MPVILVTNIHPGLIKANCPCCNCFSISVVEVQMYLIILELLEKWEDALKLIEGPLGGNFGCIPTLQFSKKGNTSGRVAVSLSPLIR